MNKESIIKLHKSKLIELEKHNSLYYDKSQPKISDSEYDDLKNVLIKLQGAEPTGLFSRNLSECLRLHYVQILHYIQKENLISNFEGSLYPNASLYPKKILCCQSTF